MDNKNIQIKRLAKYLKPYAFRFIIALICMIALAACDVYVLTWLKKLIDGIFLQHNTVKELMFVASMIPALYGAISLMDYAQSYLLGWVGQHIIKDMRLELHEKMMSLSHDFYVQNSSAKMMSRVTNDLNAVAGAISGVPSALVRQGFTFIGMVFYVFYLNWKFSLLVLVCMPVLIIPLSIFAKKLRKYSAQSQSQMGEIYSSLHQMLNGFSLIRAFNTEKFETARFQRDNDESYDIAMRATKINARTSPMVEFLGAVAGALLLLIGGRDVINGVWSAGAFMTFFYAVTKMYQPVKSFAGLNATIQGGIASAERVFFILDQIPTIKDAPDAVVLKPFSKAIEYKNVDFGYTPGTLVLKNFSINIKHGEIAAFVGHSGSGKTTIANLITRFYDPQSGEILIDGINIKKVTLKSLRDQVSIVSQDVTLFDNTVRYNISYGSFNASQEEIVRAAKMANAHEFISKLPKGYDTPIGERGMKLSGGEKQRISIARAILKNSPVLVLDEATSALDSESEKLVQEAIDNLMKNRTVILIAHRLATVRNADKILVMDAGKIIETGTHDELIKIQDGLYKKLIQLQTL